LTNLNLFFKIGYQKIRLCSQKIRMTITLKKSLDIMELFVKAGVPLNVREISQHISLPESTLYRYIRTLLQRDFIEYDPSSQKYRLGMNVIRLGSTAAKQLEIHRCAYSLMEELARKAGETVLLILRKGMHAIVVEVVDSGRAGIKLAVNRGDILPLHSCALTRPLMAFLPDEEIDSILRANPPKQFTKYTIIDLLQIKKELKKACCQGYSYSDQEVTVGARGLGAPVWNYSRTVIGTLGLAGSIHNFQKGRIPSLLKLLLEATEQCSLKMGFKP
jgi:IclR family KDG regulon transcriptional repressor